MQTYGFKRVMGFAVSVILISMIAFALPGVASAQTGDPGVASKDGIVPIFVPGNPSCESIGYGFGFKINQAPNGTYYLTPDYGELTGGAPSDPFNTVTISDSDGYLFDWAATLGIDVVIVKGGPNSDAYVYDPEGLADYRLHAPVNPTNGQYYGISHVEFCYDYELTATKTANAEYTRTIDWTITKEPDGFYEGFIGDPAFNHQYVVTVDKTVTDSDWNVVGGIMVNNPTPFTVGFGVSDYVGGSPATVTCDVYELGPGQTATCSYIAGLTGPNDGTNSATITSENPLVLGTTAGAPYAFGDPTTVIGYPTIGVTDDLYGYLGTADDDTSFSYVGEFQCPTDRDLYRKGTYSMPTRINTATIDETGQNDIAEVYLTCYAPLLHKDAAATYNERHIWDVDKVVTPESQGGFPGSILNWTWNIVVSETYVNEAFAVSGKIMVGNPAGSPGAMTVQLSDMLNDGTIAIVDCGNGGTSVSVPPGETRECVYSASPAGSEATLNTAVGSFNSLDLTAEAPVVFERHVLNENANVIDTETGLDRLLAAGYGPWTFTATDSHSCSSNMNDYFVDGVYTQMKWTKENWAYVYSDDGLNDKDDATTTYTCDATFVNIYKTTNGEAASTAMDISFELYQRAEAGALEMDSVSTLNNGASMVFDAALVPGGDYTICESPVPAGYTFEISVNGGNVLTYAGPPGATNPTGEIQCFDFSGDPAGTTVTYFIENRYPGGAPRTPGYWKNWSSCSGGNQAQTAANLGGAAAGVYLLDDLLPQKLGIFDVSTCKVGVRVLSAQNVANGKNMANDAAYELARNLLAARLNQDAGACIPSDTFGYHGNTLTFEQLLGVADTLLADRAFNGTGGYLGPKIPAVLQPVRVDALYLAGIIDGYNNGEFCIGEPSH